MNYAELTSHEDWNNYFLNELKSNGFDDSELSWKNSDSTFRFVHFSPNVKSILESRKINVSGGGLLGVVYVTPVHVDGHVHNLGQYIFDVEIPQSSNIDEVECLVFEISEEQYRNSLIQGKINYIFESKYYTKTEGAPDVLSLCKQALADIDKLLNLKQDLFLKEIVIFFTKFPALKHIYFESLNEYLYVRQNSKISLDYAENGEVYAKGVKNYLFETTPILKTSFSTTHFVTDTSSHQAKLKEQNQIISNFNSEDFTLFMCARIAFYLKSLTEKPDAILGRLMLKNSPEDVRNSIEQSGLNCFLKDKEGVTLFQYDTIPKGEMGIAPNSHTKVYKAIYSNGLVELNDVIDIEIKPLLIPNNRSVLRVK
jgi:hypothetical protein